MATPRSNRCMDIGTGLKISYTPKKPGRPRHVLPTYWIGHLPLVLDAEVQKGKAHAPE